MKFAFIIPSLHPGGMEKVMSVLLQSFAQREEKTELHLILYGIKRDIFYDIPPSIVIHRPTFTFNNRWRLWHTLKSLIFLRQKVQSLKPDSILSFGERWNNMVLLAGLGANWPVYVSDRCQPDKSLGRVHDFLRNWLYPKTKGVIVQTEQAKKIYQKMYHNPNTQVIGNPIKQVGLINEEDREKIVLCVGRLIDSKHHAELIQLFAELNIPDWKLVIVGGDALRQNNFKKLSSLINVLGVQDKVHLTGAVKDVESWYRKARIFAFPSSSEGFPNVVGEAFANDLPAIAFDCVAGPRDLIQHDENGFLVETYNFDDFATHLSRLINNDELRERMAAKARDSVLRFREEEIAEHFYQLMKTSS
ncbi:MAG: glycosyltransferase involved in cell wall biosynthesis [Patiriisocius sp.]|jgi:glycosyltransferase involved in cell wall biosynthesis